MNRNYTIVTYRYNGKEASGCCLAIPMVIQATGVYVDSDSGDVMIKIPPEDIISTKRMKGKEKVEITAW